ncbi:MAG: IS607 family transposase [Xenococcaceae cyanobacterium MO_207.B15]|nr:IS607 family transposase [Xenococcaceae cyanobacterium MO_207.B15]
MKLSDYGKQAGISYQTAWRMWKRRELNAYQLPTGTIIVKTEESEIASEPIACIYSRVSSAENKSNLDAQAIRLTNFAIAKGYRVYKVVKEVGSGLNDNGKQLAKILVDDNYNILIVEHKDRLARFGTNYLKILLEKTGKKLEIVNEADNGKDELLEDLVAIITSFCARLYGLRRSKRKTEKIIKELTDNEAGRKTHSERK